MDELTYMQEVIRRIESEMAGVLKKLLDPDADVAELRGHYRGLDLAKQTAATAVNEIEREANRKEEARKANG